MERPTTELEISCYKDMYDCSVASKQQASRAMTANVAQLENITNCCRVCGRKDDGTLIDIDQDQEFEFEPSIRTFRLLFQRTSLQFQFHTMPDLPTRICARCGYRAKMFYCFTREFVLSQHSMRAAISEWYRSNHGIEAPEQEDDLIRVKEELLHVAAEEEKIADAVRKSLTITKSSATSGLRELVKSCVVKTPEELAAEAKAQQEIKKINRINELAKLKKPPFFCPTCGWHLPSRADLIAHCGVRPCTRKRSVSDISPTTSIQAAPTPKSERAKAPNKRQVAGTQTGTGATTARKPAAEKAAPKKLAPTATRPDPTMSARNVRPANPNPPSRNVHAKSSEDLKVMQSARQPLTRECSVQPRMTPTEESSSEATPPPAVPPSRAQLQRQQQARQGQWR